LSLFDITVRFRSARRDELPDLNQQPSIYWERTRGKTKQIAKTCLSETTVILLKEYLFNFPTDNPYLFHSNYSHISDVTVNQRLRDLAHDADIKIGARKRIVKRTLSSHPIEMRNVDLQIAERLHRRQPSKRVLNTGENHEKRWQDDAVHRV